MNLLRNKNLSLIIVLVMAATILGYLARDREWLSGRNACVNDLRQTTKEYIKGRITVGFNSRVTENEARLVVTSYNLTVENLTNIGERLISSVKVPEGKELESICKLKSHPKVTYSELQFPVSIQ